jgi:pimeloyl-ACP methyl ester carboxylesterase
VGEHVYGQCVRCLTDGIDRMLDRAGERRAAIVGVSFGGLIATRYAARRAGRVSALSVLVSTPPPRFSWMRVERRTSSGRAAGACRRSPRALFSHLSPSLTRPGRASLVVRDRQTLREARGYRAAGSRS